MTGKIKAEDSDLLLQVLRLTWQRRSERWICLTFLKNRKVSWVKKQMSKDRIRRTLFKKWLYQSSWTTGIFLHQKSPKEPEDYTLLPFCEWKLFLVFCHETVCSTANLVYIFWLFQEHKKIKNDRNPNLCVTTY